MAFTFLIILAIAVAFILLITVRLQRNLLTKAPVYAPNELYKAAVDQVDKGQYIQAEDSLQQALISQDDASYRSELAVVEYHLKKYAESIADYHKLIDQNKDPGFAWNGIGNAYRDWADADHTHSQQYRDSASQAYKTAIATNPGYVAAYSNLALMLSANGDMPGALLILDKGIAATKQPEADLLMESLKKKGFGVATMPVPDSPLLRVLVGPFPDAAALTEARQKLKDLGISGPIPRKL